MDFKPASNEFSLPEVILTDDELRSIETMKSEEAERTLRQMGFEFGVNNTNISQQEFGMGVLRSIGYVATADKMIGAADPLSRGFYDGRNYVSAQNTIRRVEADYSIPRVVAQG